MHMQAWSAFREKCEKSTINSFALSNLNTIVLLLSLALAPESLKIYEKEPYFRDVSRALSNI